VHSEACQFLKSAQTILNHGVFQFFHYLFNVAPNTTTTTTAAELGMPIAVPVPRPTLVVAVLLLVLAAEAVALHVLLACAVHNMDSKLFWLFFFFFPQPP